MESANAVTAVDEPGTVTLSEMQPVVGAELTATLMDADGMISGMTWQWASSDMMGGTYMDIDGATMASYTPREAVVDDPATADVNETSAGDVGMYLRATAMYTDGHGESKSAAMESANAVTAADEPGAVTLSATEPVVGTLLTATLMDADVVVAESLTWQWASSDMMGGTYMDIDGATMASYTPREAVVDDPATADVNETSAGDVGMYLRATAMYTDGHGESKSAAMESRRARQRQVRDDGVG
jgi:hypothetical protein